MKKETKTKKTTKKTVSPKFIVDLTKAESATDVYAQFALAKQEAGLPLSNEEFNAIMLIAGIVAVEDLGEAINNVSKSIEIKNGEKLVFDAKGHFTVKKPNIFRRFWNWITRKNK